MRSFDRRMPEEINRVIADHTCDYLFAPTEISKKLLLKEGIEDEKIFVTGNNIVDAVFQNLKLAKSDVLKEMDLKEKEYILVTAHREENVDDPGRFRKILKGIDMVSKELDMPAVYPIHPRSRKMMERFGLSSSIKLIEPVDYLNFLKLEAGARLVLTDSGGVQEERHAFLEFHASP